MPDAADVLSLNSDVLSAGGGTPPPPTPPVASEPPVLTTPSGAPDRYQPRIDAALGKQEARIEDAITSMDREQQLVEEKTRALAPIRHQQMEIARQPVPEVPTLREPPPVPKDGPQQQKDRENWLFAASLLGSLSGAFTRRHVTNALGAFQGAMEGYAQGNKQAFDQNMKVWEAENKRVQEQNATVMTRYREILENRRLSQEQKSVELQTAAAEFDDKAMATAARTKNDLTIAQLYDKIAQSQNQMRTSTENIQARYAQMQQKERFELLKAQMRSAGFGTSTEQMQSTISSILDYRAAPIKGRAGTAIMNEVYRQAEESGQPYDENKWKEASYRRMIPARAEAAGLTSAERVSGTRVANLELIVRTTNSLIPLAAKTSDELPRGSWISINKLVQMGEHEISDPALARFRLINMDLARNFARTFSPSGVNPIDTQRAILEELSTATGPETYKAQLEVIHGALMRELQAGIEQQKHIAPAPFDLSGGAPAPAAAAGGGGAAAPAAPATPKLRYNPATGQIE